VPAERLRQLHPVGVAERQVCVSAELVFLLPGDQATGIVFSHHDRDIGVQAARSLHILHVHHKAGVTAYRHDLALGKNKVGSDHAGQSESQGTETIRDQAGIRSMAPIIAGNPHPVRAHGRQTTLRQAPLK